MPTLQDEISSNEDEDMHSVMDGRESLEIHSVIEGSDGGPEVDEPTVETSSRNGGASAGGAITKTNCGGPILFCRIHWSPSLQRAVG
jgi:hypothetical protein